MIYQQILDMEDEFNQKITDLVISMSDIVIYVVDVKQFATIAKLKLVIEEANILIGRAVDFFNKHKEHGSYSEYSLIDFFHRLTYLKNSIQRGYSLRFREMCRKSSMCSKQNLPGLEACSIAASQYRL